MSLDRSYTVFFSKELASYFNMSLYRFRYLAKKIGLGRKVGGRLGPYFFTMKDVKTFERHYFSQA